VRNRTYDYAEVRRLYDSAVTVDEIADRIGAARSTVWRILNGHKPASGAQAKKVDREVLLRLWQQNLTLEEIGLAIGCSGHRWNAGQAARHAAARVCQEDAAARPYARRDCRKSPRVQRAALR
jgi:predicted transcriptional regulator